MNLQETDLRRGSILRSGAEGTLKEQSRFILRIGYNPDPHDAFVFFGIASGGIETPGYAVRQIVDDIESLNRRAVNGELEISTVSIHAYAHMADQYTLSRYGAIAGEGSGPLVVAAPELDPEGLPGASFAVPGTMTSAFLALQLYLGQGFNFRIYPYDRILEAVASGEAQAGLVIHESQFTYERAGLRKLVDLGLWWADHTDGLPLPLGAIAVRRDLGKKIHSDIGGILRSSIEYGLRHRDEAVAFARKFGRGLDDDLTGRLLDLYFNDLTLDLGERGIRAVRRFLDDGAEAGLIPRLKEVELIT